MRCFPFVLAAALLPAVPAAAQAGEGIDALAAADANGDGQITRAEFNQARLARFAKMDRNGDGAISKKDVGGMVARFRPDAVQKVEAFIARADTNGDAKVTRDELAKSPMLVFDRADADRNGVIDRAELDRARASAR